MERLDPIPIIFDMDLGRPACALLQAGMGGAPHAASLFHNEAWLLNPTPAMKRYLISPDELVKVAAVVNHRFPMRSI